MDRKLLGCIAEIAFDKKIQSNKLFNFLLSL